MIKTIQIGNREVGYDHSPFLIAEMSGNHNQSLDRAFEIIDAAAASGAHAVKLQTYTADTMTIDSDKKDFLITDKDSLWYGRRLYDLYGEAYTPWEWHKPLFDRCKEMGMEFFSTPFDETSVDFLDKLGVPCFKVASFENTCLPLLKKVASKKKPVIMSTGMASVEELAESVRVLKENGCNDIILLKCTSNYPALPKNANLNTIPHMKDLFNVQIGLSDHSMGCGVAVAATVLGATAIEKHFTLRRLDGGVDSEFSMEPEEFKTLSKEVERAWHSLGRVTYGTGSEEKSKAFRRSIYIVRDVKKGDVLTPDNIRYIRPGYSLSSKYYESLLGKRVNIDLQKGDRLAFENIDFSNSN